MTHDFQGTSKPTNGNFWFYYKPEGKHFIIDADFTNEKPKKGDQLIGITGLTSSTTTTTIDEILENRNSRGKYSKPEMAEGAFFKLKCTRV